MLLRLIVLFAGLLHLTRAAETTQEYGVGFSLSLDYATASIHFENGSFVDVAKIEGGQHYKAMMRSPEITREEDDYERRSTIQALKKRMTGPFGLHVLGEYLPHWFRISSRFSGNGASHTESLYPMLKALKSAVDAYIEEPCSSALTVTPFHGSILFLEALGTAGTALGLRDMPLVRPRAAVTAAYAQGFGGKCHTDFWGDPANDFYDPPRLSLVVDYSRAAFTCALLFEECSAFEIERMTHNTSLGYDVLAEHSFVEIIQAIRDVAKIPVEGRQSETEGLTAISHLFLTGELADNQLLQDAARDGLSEHAESLGLRKEGYPVVPRTVEPTFSTARGAALWHLGYLFPTVEYCASDFIDTRSALFRTLDSWRGWMGL